MPKPMREVVKTVNLTIENREFVITVTPMDEDSEHSYCYKVVDPSLSPLDHGYLVALGWVFRNYGIDDAITAALSTIWEYEFSETRDYDNDA